MVRRHDKMRQQWLSRRFLVRCVPDQRCVLAGNALWAQRGEKIKLRAPRLRCALVGEVDNVALAQAVDSTVWCIHEALHVSPVPVITARLPPGAVHTLLHNRPMPVVGHEETVQVEIEPVLNGCTIDLGDETARSHQRRRIEPS